MSSEICNEWRANKLANPKTGRAIKQTGKVYKSLVKQCSQASHPSDEKLTAHRESIKKDPVGLTLMKDMLLRLHQSLNYLMNPKIDPSTGAAPDPLRQNILEVQSNQIQRSFDAQRDLTFKRYNDKDKVKIKTVTFKTICADVVNKFTKAPQDIPLEQGYVGTIDKVRVHVIKAPVDSKVAIQYSVGALVNYFVDAQVCPNYQYNYGKRICTKCELTGQDSQCALIFKEAYDLTLANLFSSSQPQALELSILGQLIMAIHYLNHNLGVLHNNLLSENIYLKKTPELQGQYMIYMVKGLGMFLIENQGYMVILGNFNDVKVVDDSMMKFRNDSNKYRLYSAFVQDNINSLRIFQGGEHNKGTHQPLEISPSLKWILSQLDKDPSVKLGLLKAQQNRVVGATLLLDIIKLVYKEGDLNMIRSLVFHPVN